ncbi:MAG: carboxypeptidase M32 [Armatimonadota bacterium]|nr:carboxypeptidase M32 [Armatimonadota bacterium]MDR7463786.1 carboxypeptidase M32 [Armatimonadota bacterium]MDR7469468.1 carboxypeptidase M32 [Armatimonadota bacterium]MDR7473826.1 carboxypeptidase M32 [Armatimonadota bacterium]MDR7539115.1 carboxypeptidase M32 [Armatimonadota bacterium]
MPQIPEAIEQLRAHLAPIVDLRHAAGVLGWDQQTHMPPGGGRARAEQLATLSRLIHEMFTSRRTGELLEAAERAAEQLDPDSDEAALVRVTRRDYDRATKLPSEFVAARSRASSLSIEAWRQARPANDFAAFCPHLQQMVDYARRTADYLGYAQHPYDALLDLYEPLMTSREVTELFARLREGIVPLVRAIAAAPQVDDSVLHQEYDEAKQQSFALEVVQAFGYDISRGRLDRAPHPFAASFSRDDARITTRFDRRFFNPAVFAIFHEAGHAMYHQGMAPSLERTPLAGGASLGVHESQSRMWENLVGRSRPFWQHYFPRLRELFPEQLTGVDAEGFYRAVNKVQPSLIRVEADEVTYNLHIILRFELEKALVEGSLRVEDAPGAWNARMAEYLGVTPPSDADGLMQDIHWASGSIGYFPTYTLGNVMAAQLFAAALREHPALPEDFARGEFRVLLEWLRKHVHRHGRKFFPQDLLQRATGSRLTPEPYLRYLWVKFGEIYGISAPETAGLSFP